MKVKLHLVGGEEVIMEREEFMELPFPKLSEKLNHKPIFNVEFLEE